MGYGFILIAIIFVIAITIYLVFQSRDRVILMAEDHNLLGKMAQLKEKIGSDAVFLYKQGDSIIEIIGEFSGNQIEINHTNLQNARHVKLLHLMKTIYYN